MCFIKLVYFFRSVLESKPIDLTRSQPVNMPFARANAITIESTSANSCEQALLDNYRRGFEEGGAGELQLKEDLADAMLESPGIRDTGKVVLYSFLMLNVH